MDVRQLLVLMVAFTFAAVAAGPTHAQVFKCHDDQGQIVFSSFPCGDSIERVPVSVGSGDRTPAAEDPEPAPEPVAAPSADAEFQVAGATGNSDLDPESLSPEQIELLQMHQQLQRQSEERAQAIANSQQQAMFGEPLAESSTAYASSQSVVGQNDGGNAACESAEARLDSLREQGRRGYSASQSRSHKARVRQAKDRVRDACRRR